MVVYTMNTQIWNSRDIKVPFLTYRLTEKEKKRIPNYSPFSHVHVNFAFMEVKESNDKGGPLEADHSAEHV